MYKKLRRNFMLVSTLVLLVVISAVSGIVYWMASNTILYQTNVLTEMILDNGGELPDQSEFNNQQKAFLALSAESLHEIRYYTATIRSDSTEISNVHIIIDEPTPRPLPSGRPSAVVTEVASRWPEAGE